MNNNAIISADKISKKFCRSLKHAMLYGMKDVLRTSFRLSTHSDELRPGEFWAVHNLTFEIKKGECLGIIGPNGSGKTTILKMINGIFMPDGGIIKIRGRVGALIQLGAGFHPMLTGRENIYVNGSILGMSKKEINQKFDSIVDFAGIGDFLDSPVKYYSSGMYVRLGFAVAAHSEPDILLVDEVLAVGDVSFQEKCMAFMAKIRSSDKIVILVSHSMYRIESLCDHALWIEYGEQKKYGHPREVINAYLNDQERKIMVATGENISSDELSAFPVKVEKVELASLAGDIKKEFAFSEGLIVRIYYNAKKRIERPLFNIRFFHKSCDVMEASMLIDGYGPDHIEGNGIVECQFDFLSLTPKVYDIFIFVREASGIADIIEMKSYATFRVTEKNLERIPLGGPMAINHLRQGSPVYVPRKWRFLKNQTKNE